MQSSVLCNDGPADCSVQSSVQSTPLALAAEHTEDRILFIDSGNLHSLCKLFFAML